MFNRLSLIGTLILCTVFAFVVNGVWNLLEEDNQQEIIKETFSNPEPEHQETEDVSIESTHVPEVAPKVELKTVESTSINSTTRRYGVKEIKGISQTILILSKREGLSLGLRDLNCEGNQCKVIISGNFNNAFVAKLTKELQNAEWNKDMSVNICDRGITLTTTNTTFAHICLQHDPKSTTNESAPNHYGKSEEKFIKEAIVEYMERQQIDITFDELKCQLKNCQIRFHGKLLKTSYVYDSMYLLGRAPWNKTMEPIINKVSENNGITYADVSMHYSKKSYAYLNNQTK